MSKEMVVRISEWIDEYADANNLSTLVVGVSGGVDSALVSTLCAMTGRRTILLNIPINSKPENSALSDLHCEWLNQRHDNVEVFNVDLSDTFATFKNTIRDHIEENPLALANTKSRLRMTLLYQFATTFNGLVVGTGNKVEDFGVGFYTKYGDGGVDISPIADLTKTQVREFATSLEIPQPILDAPPTDGLWEDNRTDEDQIGASYEEMEWAMDYIDNHRMTDLSSRQQEVLEIFTQYRDKNTHKMKPIPVFCLEDVI